LSVVVKIHEARVDYPDGDYVQNEDGYLYIFNSDDTVVGVHNEWRYAAVFENKEPSVAELAAQILSRVSGE
jgi:hypothetical protein